MPALRSTQMNGQDDADLLWDDWVVVDHIQAPVMEEDEDELHDEEEGLVTRMNEVLTLREDHFRQPPEAPGFVSLTELYSPEPEGYDSALEEEVDEFINDLLEYYILNDIVPFDGDDGDEDVDGDLPPDHQFHLLKLWKLVTELGGHNEVTTIDLWEEIAEELGLPSEVSVSLAKLYEKVLLGYENYKFGNSSDDDDAEVVEEEEEQVPPSVEVPVLDAAPAEQTQEQNGDGSRVPAPAPEESFSTWAAKSFMV